MSKAITHEGVVIKTEGTQVSVMIVQHSACSGCHARGACTASDQKEKIIVAESLGATFQAGERVMLVGSNSMAWSALTYAFLLPLVLCMVVLFVVGSLAGEAKGALAVFILLAVYYVVLFCFRDKLKTQFSFRVQKLETV
jgi:sigma-E factor negative regulatory protein RseC